MKLSQRRTKLLSSELAEPIGAFSLPRSTLARGAAAAAAADDDKADR